MEEGSSEPLPSLMTRQGGDMTSRMWLNGKFRTKPWTQTKSKAPESPPDQVVNEVSDIKLDFSDSESEGTYSCAYPAFGIDDLVRRHLLLPESGVLLLVHQLISDQISHLGYVTRGVNCLVMG